MNTCYNEIIETYMNHYYASEAFYDAYADFKRNTGLTTWSRNTPGAERLGSWADSMNEANHELNAVNRVIGVTEDDYFALRTVARVFVKYENRTGNIAYNNRQLRSWALRYAFGFSK